VPGEAPAVEQSRLAEHASTRADAEDPCPFVGLPSQPGGAGAGESGLPPVQAPSSGSAILNPAKAMILASMTKTSNGDCDESRLGAPADAGKDTEAADPARLIAIVAFDGVEAIDIGAPASVFSKAAQLHPGSYRLWIASPDGGTVTTPTARRRQARERPCALRSRLVIAAPTGQMHALLAATAE